MDITRISVNGEIYQIDYNGLANKPDLTKDTVPTADSNKYITSGAVFAVLTRLNSIDNRLSVIEQKLSGTDGEESISGTTKVVDGEKLALSGSQVNAVAPKLSLFGSDFSVTGEKLSIS